MQPNVFDHGQVSNTPSEDKNISFRMHIETTVLSSVDRWSMQLSVVIPWICVNYCHSFPYQVILQSIGVLLKMAGLRGKPTAEYMGMNVLTCGKDSQEW